MRFMACALSAILIGTFCSPSVLAHELLGPCPDGTTDTGDGSDHPCKHDTPWAYDSAGTSAGNHWTDSGTPSGGGAGEGEWRAMRRYDSAADCQAATNIQADWDDSDNLPQKATSNAWAGRWASDDCAENSSFQNNHPFVEYIWWRNTSTTAPATPQREARETVSHPQHPTLLTAWVDGETLALNYEEVLDATSVPAADAFEVVVEGSTVSLADTDPVAVYGRMLVLKLANAVTQGQVVTVSYTVPTTDPIRDAGGNNARAQSGWTVTNYLVEGCSAPTLTDRRVIGIFTVTVAANTSVDFEDLTEPLYGYVGLQSPTGTITPSSGLSTEHGNYSITRDYPCLSG